MLYVTSPPEVKSILIDSRKLCTWHLTKLTQVQKMWLRIGWNRQGAGANELFLKFTHSVLPTMGVMTCTMTGRFDVSSVKLMECKGPPHLSPGSSCPIRTSLLFLTASCLLLTTIIHRLLLSLNPSSVKKNPPVLMIILNFFFSTCHPLLSFLQDAVLTCFSLSKYEIKIYQHSHVDSSSTCHVFSYAKETSLYLWYLRKYRLGGTWSLDS